MTMHQATILVVDDVEANRRYLIDLLRVSGYEAMPASGGAEALELIKTVSPDLVLLDILMPGMSGYEVCRRIREDPENAILPVIMVTSLEPTEERVKGLEAGADDFLTKPINRAELLARVRSLLRIKSLYDTVQAQAAELTTLNAGLEHRVQDQLGQLQRLSRLKRFFTPQLAELIVSGDMDDPLVTRRREVTVALVELRGFTALADTSEPEEVMGILRSYHREMGEAIESQSGTLEQLTANTMLVIFNDPVIVEDPAVRAVAMATDMQARFGAMMSDWQRRGHDVGLSIGIAHGYATIGAIGYEARLGYGVIGRVTNLAQRLCSEAGPGQILVSAPVYALVETHFCGEEQTQVNMQDFARAVGVYAITRRQEQGPHVSEKVWPLKIHTLGRFSLEVNGEPLKFSRKAQKRPLDLLKILVALGGEGVEIGTLAALMWPDALGDGAKVSFDSTLYRLRKLIGNPELLVLSEGRLSLDQARCWVDIWALNSVFERVEKLAPSPDAADPSHANGLVRELLRLYAGHFLDPDSQDAWTLSARDQLRARFVRAVTKLGDVLEKENGWEQVTDLYLRALELDNLAEPLYRRLMIAYRAQGEPAEAINIYRRCRDMLSIVLNTKPSPETEAIRTELDRQSDD